MPQRPQDQYVKVGDVNTRFWSAGKQGSPVLLIHGLGASVEIWTPNFDALAQRHRVYALDVVGFGLSDKRPEMLTPTGLPQFVKDFMDVEHITRTSLVGNSMGGMISLRMAIDYPDRVDRVVLVDAGGLGREASSMLRLGSITWLARLTMRPTRKTAARILNSCFCDPAAVTDQMVEQSYQMISQPGAIDCAFAAIHRGFTWRGQRTDLVGRIVENLGKIAAPTLVVWGREDRVLPMAHAQVAAKGIPHSSVLLIDRAGHLPQLERPEEFNKAVLEFLAG